MRFELRDLGEHRLRDLSAPERLYQVIAAGLMAEFPPLRTLDRTPNNLPTQPTVLIGRDIELERIRRHLDSSRVRILTLTGPGGIGKTRLALQAAANQADRVRDGIYFVDLTEADDAPGALREIARTLGLAVRAGADLRAAVAEQIDDRDLLVVLDNFEQVMAAADDVAELLRLCPHLRVIVTSRESLRVRGEQLIEVTPLSFPDGPHHPSAADLARFEAVRLFVERASEARSDFSLTDDNAALVADVCARLDGLPLAIELAAARLRLFSLEELRDRLGSSLDVLRGGARDLPLRQRTLMSTIAWSHDLLDQDERAVFHLLSVFASADIDAVEQVASRLDWLADVDVVDVLASLVDKSLIRGTANGRGQRLSMLETIREYAVEQLAVDPARAELVRDAHATFYAEFAMGKIGGLAGPARMAALDEIAVELGNLVVAWHRFVDRAEFGRLHGLLDVLWPLYETRGWYQGALALLNDLLLVLPTMPTAPERRAKEITLRISIARVLLALQGYTDEVEHLYRQAIALAEAEGSIPTQLPVLRSLASFYLYRGEMDKTAAIGAKVLRLAEADNDVEAMVDGHLITGPPLAFMGQWREGLDHLDQAIDLFDVDRPRTARFRLGPNPGVAAAAVSGLLHWQFGFPETADQRAALALELGARVQHPYSRAYAGFHVGILDLWSGRFDAARQRGADVQALATTHEYPIWVATGLVLEGAAMAALGDPAEGMARAERGVSLYQEHPTPPVFWPIVLAFRGMAATLNGRLDHAMAVLDEAVGIAGTRSWDAALALIQRGDVQALRGDVVAAEADYRLALAAAGPGNARSSQLAAATRLARLSDAGRQDALATLQAVLPTLTEGFDTALVRDARAVLDAGVAAAADA